MSRRKNRKARRKQKREKPAIELVDILTYKNLYIAARLSCKLIGWKLSVQRFLLSILFRLYQAKQDILSDIDIRQGFICFRIFERGKEREIQSLYFMERFIQKLICIFILLPLYRKSFIKENSASQKGKGTLFASKTLEKHLREFLRKHSTGYIMLIDFSKYFENMNQDIITKFYNDNFHDERLKSLLIKSVTAYEKGVGLGSEISQFNAIMYLNKIDHFIKSNFKYYGRYMDDSYIICEDKEKLKNFSEILFKKYEEIGIIVNKKKTKILSLNKHFTFLKTRYKIIKNNKIIKKPSRESITRNRKKFRKMVKLVLNGELTKDDLYRAFKSWAGSMKRRNARKSVYKIRKEIDHALCLQSNDGGVLNDSTL